MLTKKLTMLLSLTLLSLIFFSLPSYAGQAKASLIISVSVVCNCNVNGVIVPIKEGACVPTCNKLKEQNDTSQVQISQNGNVKTVMY